MSDGRRARYVVAVANVALTITYYSPSAHAGTEPQHFSAPSLRVAVRSPPASHATRQSLPLPCSHVSPYYHTHTHLLARTTTARPLKSIKSHSGRAPRSYDTGQRRTARSVRTTCCSTPRGVVARMEHDPWKMTHTVIDRTARTPPHKHTTTDTRAQNR